jgi:hypothetical protein
VFHGPVQGGHWSLLVIDRTEYEPGIFNRIPNASQSQTFTFPKCDILIWKRGQLTKCSLFMQEAHCNIFERGFKDINSPLFGLATFHLRSESSLVVITQSCLKHLYHIILCGRATTFISRTLILYGGWLSVGLPLVDRRSRCISTPGTNAQLYRMFTLFVYFLVIVLFTACR